MSLTDEELSIYDAGMKRGFDIAISKAAQVIEAELAFHVHGRTPEHKAATAHLLSLRNKILEQKLV